MAGISSSIGLITGVNITDTVNQLIAIQATPRDLLTTANKKVESQRTAITQLTAQVVAIQITARKFATADIYTQRTTTSSTPTVIEATGSGTPDLGSFQYTSVRLARAQQLQSSRFTSNSAALGAGTFKFRFGGFVDHGVGLETLNDGQGFQAGKISITDRSGANAQIDLTYAQSLDDVINAVNSNTKIKVKLQAVNDHLQLLDLSGGSASNLKVEEVTSGTTAASLGLSSVNVAATTANGTQIIKLFGDLGVEQLNDGRGVRFDGALDDLRVNFRDGTSSVIDFQKLATTGNKASGITTATNGTNAQVNITAVNTGPAYGNVQVVFQNNVNIEAGNETVAYDTNSKTLTFQIDEGNTTADQAIAALGNNATVSALFTASRAASGSGAGLLTATDSATLTGPKATATTSGADSVNAKLLFTAVTPGESLNDVQIQFIDDVGITGGSETVTFDQSNPNQKKLIFRIDQGNTNANDIVRTLTDDPIAKQYFIAANVSGSTGLGKVVPEDNVSTSGGKLLAASSKIEQVSLQEVVDLLNSSTAGKLTAAIVNNHLQLTDNTTNGGFTFSLQDLNHAHVARDLGLNVSASGSSLTGKRIFGGLKTSLISSLNGGAGLGTLGSVQLTDRGGSAVSVDLSSAETIDDLIALFNQSGLSIKASYNDARNGIVLNDTTGATTSNLIIANGDVTNSADKLGLTVNAAVTKKNSGDLKLQFISEATKLAKLNGGAGVNQGTFSITDNTGTTKSLTIDSKKQTIGDVIDAINNLGLALTAKINEAGDGIQVTDTTATGGSLLSVTDGGSSTARDLGLLQTATTKNINGTDTKIINGTFTNSITLSATDTLSDLTTKINALNVRVRANTFNDGSGVKPFRFNLFNQVSGSAGQLLLDSSGVSFTLNQTVAGQDALLQIGGEGGPLASSSTNTFKEILPNVQLTLKSVSTDPVTVSVTNNNESLVTTLKQLVTSYNKVRDAIKTLTAYNTDTQTGAILQGDTTTLRVESDLNRLVSGRFFQAGPIRSLQTLGISLDSDGKLQLDETKLNTAINERPDDVKTFLSKTDTGFGKKLDTLLEQISGPTNSLLVSRITALTKKFDSNNARVTFLTAQLDRAKTRLTAQFQASEIAVAKIQANLTYVNQLATLANSYNSSSSSSSSN